MIVFLPMIIIMYDVTAQDSASLTITLIKQLCILTNEINAAEHIALNYRYSVLVILWHDRSTPFKCAAFY